MSSIVLVPLIPGIFNVLLGLVLEYLSHGNSDSYYISGFISILIGLGCLYVEQRSEKRRRSLA